MTANIELMFVLNVFMLVILRTLAWQKFIFLNNNNLYCKIIIIFFVCLHEHVLKCTYKLLPLENTTKRSNM